MSTLLASEPAAAQTVAVPPLFCLTTSEQDKLAKDLIALDKCRIDLAARQQIVDTRVMTYAGTPAIAFWQEPTAIVAGIVVSISVTAGLTFWLAKR